MISYCWSQQKTALKLCDSLRASGFTVWIDVEQMQGYLLERMAEAVENAFAVIICVSEKYRTSSNCRSEANYSYELGRELIPVIVEKNYLPTGGWLRLMISGRLYYQAHDDQSFQESAPRIIKLLQTLDPQSQTVPSQTQPSQDLKTSQGQTEDVLVETPNSDVTSETVGIDTADSIATRKWQRPQNHRRCKKELCSIS